MFTNYGQWWDAPPEEMFRAYYMLFRTIYGYRAMDAFEKAQAAFTKYPEFFSNPIGTLREAVSFDQNEKND